MKRIYLSPPHLTEEGSTYVNQAIGSNWIAPLGPDVDAFEAELAAHLKVARVLTTNSGTSAIHLGLLALDVGKDDEVLCSTLTFCASATPVVYCGARPVFVDSERGTWNIDPILLEEAILDRIRRKGKKPKAIIVVHLYGMPARMRELMAIARNYEIPVLEDAAEAVGSLYHGEPVGTMGEVGVLSFNGNKIITTSGGGALLSNHCDIISKAAYFRQEAKEPLPYYEHKAVGYNYRMSNLLAALGRSQLKILGERVRRRREIFNFYVREFAGYLVSFQKEEVDMHSNRWLTCILLDKNHPKSPDDIRLALEKENIESRPLWKPMHLQPVFKDAPYYGNGVSEDLFERGLCLPSGSNLTSEDLERVVGVVRRVLRV